MKYVVGEMSGPYWVREISSHDTFEEAVAAVQKFPLLHFEEDAHNPGCADAFTKSGMLISINEVRG